MSFSYLWVMILDGFSCVAYKCHSGGMFCDRLSTDRACPLCVFSYVFVEYTCHGRNVHIVYSLLAPSGHVSEKCNGALLIDEVETLFATFRKHLSYHAAF